MNRILHLSVFLLAVAAAAIAIRAAEAPSLAVTIAPSAHTFLAGREHRLRLSVTPPAAVGGTLAWNLHYAGRTLAAGELTPGPDGAADLRFVFPELNPGVRADTLLTVSSGGATFTKTLHFFHPNPFLGESRRWQLAKIAVWSPEDEALPAWLESLEIPFSPIDDIAQATGQILLVVGVDFDSLPGVPETLADIAARGTTVIVMPPFDGHFPIPANARDVRLADNSRILEFDKTLDAESWGVHPVASRHLQMVAQDDVPVLQAATDTSARFTSCEIRTGAGRLWLLSWNLAAAAAKDSPTPGQLLHHLLSSVDN
jgi:hypothetical protein